MPIRAVSWCSPSHLGCVAADGRSNPRPPSDDALPATIEAMGGTTKYLKHLHSQTKACLWAASLALEAAGWSGESHSRRDEPADIGIVATGYQGWLEAERRYFDDYVRYGRISGRGSLFVYTLPTSVASEVSLTLGLGGPLFHFAAQTQPIEAMLGQAQLLIDDGEAKSAIALYSDPMSCVGWVVDGCGPEPTCLPWRCWESQVSPTDLAASLA